MYIVYSVALGKGVAWDYTSPWLYEDGYKISASESVMMVPGTVSIDD